MSSQASYFRIGIFVISAVIVLIACIIFFGAADLFKEEVMMETYIDGSVQGLSVGSPVKHRGVKIGTVKEITFLGFEYNLEQTEEDDPLRSHVREPFTGEVAIAASTSFGFGGANACLVLRRDSAQG